MTRLIFFFIVIFCWSCLKSQTKESRHCISWQVDKNISFDSIYVKYSMLDQISSIKKGMNEVKLYKNKFDIVFCFVAPGGYYEKTIMYRITLLNDTCLLFTYTSNGCIKKKINIDFNEFQNKLNICENGKYHYICSSEKHGQILYLIRYDKILFLLDGYGDTFENIIHQDQELIKNSMVVLTLAKEIIYHNRP